MAYSGPRVWKESPPFSAPFSLVKLISDVDIRFRGIASAFALTSLLVGSSVTSILNRAVQNNPSGGLLRAENGTFVYHWDAPLDNLRRNGDRDPGVDAALMLTVIVGCTQLLAAVCFLGGVVGRLIPDEVVSGFTSSSAVHIVTSQVRGGSCIRTWNTVLRFNWHSPMRRSDR